jgi:putative spermidine/putrescine transport system substrate-binding protein
MTMRKTSPFRIGRRPLLGALAASAAASTGASNGARAQAAQTLNIMDVAGNLALTQPIFDNYAAANPRKVSRFTVTRAPAPELAGKIRAMQAARRVDIDIILTGSFGMAAGIEQNLWTDMTPHFGRVGNPAEIYGPGALQMQNIGRNQGMLVAYSQMGPFLEYMPARVPQVPRSLAALLEWCRAHPNRFTYARPANSGPGSTFLLGLPYILGDSDPKDPANGWTKTWEYLRALKPHIDYYPSGTAAMLREFANGSRDIVPTIMGWDINPRFLGTVPKEAEVTAIENFRFVGDGHFMVMPKGLSAAKQEAVLDVMAFALQPQQQAITFDAGYLYPGPAVKGVTLDMAPAESQQIIRDFGRPMYDELIRTVPVEASLESRPLIEAFRRWDQEIAA